MRCAGQPLQGRRGSSCRGDRIDRVLQRKLNDAAAAVPPGTSPKCYSPAEGTLHWSLGGSMNGLHGRKPAGIHMGMPLEFTWEQL